MAENKASSPDQMNTQFWRIFNYKGHIAAFAKKACKNLDGYSDLHYFSIGHRFRNLKPSAKEVFKLQGEDDKEKFKLQEKVAKEFKTLQKDQFPAKILREILPNIRDIQSHYIHDFNLIKDDPKGYASIKAFLEESFWLAAVQLYRIKEDIQEGEKEEEVLKELAGAFFWDTSKKKKTASTPSKTEALNMNKKDLFNAILYVKQEKDTHFIIHAESKPNHKVFEIAEGEYLSFQAFVFLISMFLYKHEADHLLKKTPWPEDNQYQRDLMSYYSKKYSSQDIDHEDRQLVNFRDIIQYLSKYPCQWNEYLRNDDQAITQSLRSSIIEQEIERIFDQDLGDDRREFNQYVKFKLTSPEIDLPSNKQGNFEYNLNLNQKILNITQDINDPKKSKSKTKNEKNLKTQKDQLESNKNRIIKEQNSGYLFTRYGRNEDRYLQFVMRYLAENNYFGEEAQYKLYQYHDPIELRKVLENMKANKGEKKNYDSLKFHDGRLVHYTTFGKHLQAFPRWDTPFVVRDNSVSIKLKLNSGETEIILQRALMVYFFEDCCSKLKNKKPIDRSGENLLKAYFGRKKNEFDGKYKILQKNDPILAEEKTEYRKLFPRRLLHNYFPVGNTSVKEKQNQEKIDPFPRSILRKAEKAEKRYEDQKQIAEKKDSLNEFEKKNKGKQFKLQFIRQACHQMYFRAIYKAKIAAEKHQQHHKAFHITRDEYQDFSRWMYAFDQAASPNYKENLTELFKRKGFFANKEFQEVFDKSANITELYNKIKPRFKTWLDNQDPKENASRVKSLDKYELERDVWKFQIEFINLSHFIHFLKDYSKSILKEDGNLNYSVLSNKGHLLEDYYKTDKAHMPSSRRKKINQVQLEDCVLYELAFLYLDKNLDVKRPIKEILLQDIEINIGIGKTKLEDNKPDSIKIKVPFRKIEVSNVLLKKFKEEETSANFYQFVENNKEELSEVFSSLENKELTYAELLKVDQLLMKESKLMTRTILNLEKYYVWKEEKNTLIGKTNNPKNRIKTKRLNIYTKYGKDINLLRNAANHFNFPPNGESYLNKIEKIEKEFITKEGIGEGIASFDELPKFIQDICTVFIQIAHNDWYKNKNNYFKQVIKKKS